MQGVAGNGKPTLAIHTNALILFKLNLVNPHGVRSNT